MSKKLRQFAAQIENLSLKEIPARLASYLIYLSEEQEAADEVRAILKKHQLVEGLVHKQDMPRQDLVEGLLASLLGTIPETLSRIFAKLSGHNLIRVEGPKITLLDRQGLEDLAEYGKQIE